MPRRTAILLALTAVSLAAPAAAQAKAGPCRTDGTGPTCRIEQAKVTLVADGDTIKADIAGDGTRAVKLIRITGLQAMEQSVYSHTPSKRRGDCHALEATAMLERQIKRSKWKVRLLAQDPASHSGRNRPRRSVQVRRGGRWRDAGAPLVRAGLALWLPNNDEWAWNAEYHRLADQAAARGAGLYDTDSCGAGPSQGAPLALRVNWDAEGNDYANPNGEYFEVFNGGAADVPLAGWQVRDTDLRAFRFPAGAVVPAGQSVRVRVGPGGSSPSEYHWGETEPVFENIRDDGRGMGDGGYLFDPQGDLRAWDIYGGR